MPGECQFKPGDLVECVRPTAGWVTQGRIYTVLPSSGLSTSTKLGWVTLQTDTDQIRDLLPDRFKLRAHTRTKPKTPPAPLVSSFTGDEDAW